MTNYDKTDKILENIVVAFKKRDKSGRTLDISIDDKLGEYEGKIADTKVTAGSHSQLIDVLGRILRKPDLSEGVFVSKKSICGIYFATHFKNYLDAAPLDELFEYIDDLAFWGMNTLRLWFDMHHYTDMEDGKEAATRILEIMKHAKSMGIRVAMTTLANEAFEDSPKELRADWTAGHNGYVTELDDHYHMEICPSKKGGMQQILDDRRKMLEVFKDGNPDFVTIGPYDEGGCTCPDCAPWGGNGYIKTIEALVPLYKEYFPDVKLIAEFWKFGAFTGNDTEYELFYKALNEGRLNEIKYISAEPAYAEYAFKHSPGVPLIGFPEISMYGAWPWGGYGANPMPERMGRWWCECGSMLDGGFPYSEGIYEDLNKVIMLRQYRDNQSPSDPIREYLSYEFGLKDEILEKVTLAVLDMEETLDRDYHFPFVKNNEGVEEYRVELATHYYPIAHPEKAESIEKVFTEANDILPKEIKESVKWQMLYLRAVIDAEIVRNNFYRNDKILDYFKKLVKLMHVENSGHYTSPDIFEP